ncbi:MBL fold metallo-hydrolase [Polycladomyces sp. WAk]|uniref:MBL fold metallo-hydrolase n=1 Tax=Polycladomyces zharkentensis TaxID=2807616 RepID=A0ABS2WJ60_9BACL|nr:MBL fold metallo-hydrolase [Polycladomyces sp. WAk]MBN2909434.1 MBL fold metallo-hydrolase [Polycladomyces sp. WAk]
MNIQRLNWAGLLVEWEGTAVAIDPMFHVNESFFGRPRERLYPLSDFGRANAVLVTHLHSDHYDAEAIVSTYGAEVPVYVPAYSLEKTEKTSLRNGKGVRPEDTITLGSLRIKAISSVDGLGDPQVGWVVEAEGRKIIHCGDTLWHGYWWKIAEQHGPFDIAFLPVNGAIVEEEELTPSGQPICMTPEQAVSAALVLRAKKIVPIHYGTFHNPPVYNETPDLVDRLMKSARQQNVILEMLEPKQSIHIE